MIRVLSSLAAIMLAMTVGAASPDSTTRFSIVVSGNNGSLPPPHRRSTEIRINADGKAQFEKRLGYDLQDSKQRFEYAFQISADQRSALAALISELRVFETPWREVERPTVGGSSVVVSCSDGKRELRIPSQLLPEQRAARDRLVAAVQSLVPEDAHRFLAEWTAARDDQD